MRTTALVTTITLLTLSHVAHARGPRTIDAAVEDNRGNVYFFSGNQYIRFSVKHDTSYKGYPQRVAGKWPRLAWQGRFDAAFSHRGKIYFFKGSQYVTFDIARDRALHRPRPIRSRWKQWRWGRIDAAVASSSMGKVYFFSGDRRIAFYLSNNRLAKVTRIPGRERATAAFNTVWHMYVFFADGRYARYRRSAKANFKYEYLKPIRGNWSGVWQRRTKRRPGE